MQNRDYQNVKKKISLNPESQPYTQHFDEELQKESQKSQYSRFYSPGQIGMFEEFKNEYDQMKQKYEAKVKETDILSYQKKKLEVEIMNMNVEFYQREIKRLQFQVERYQQENEQNKHKFLIAQNMKKELQGSLRAKTEEVKTLIKQIEKEKIACAEIKHQLSEKDKKFSVFVQKMEESNTTLSNDYQKASEKASSLQSQLRIKNQQLQNAHSTISKLNKKADEDQRDWNSSKKIYDQKIKKHETLINELELQMRSLKNSSNEQIEALTQQIILLRTNEKNNDLLLAEKVNTATIFKSARVLEEQLHNAQTQLHNSQIELSQQKRANKKLLQQIKSLKNDEEKKSLEARIIELEVQKNDKEKQLKGIILGMEQEIERLKLKQYNSPASNQNVPRNFQQLLRNQIEQNSKTKYELETKIDQIFNLKSEAEELRLKIKALENQASILKKKIKAEQKNTKIQSQIGLQNIKNDLESVKRKLQMCENKLQNKTRQVKEKDNFISSSIIGRSRQQDVPSIMADLTRIFQTDYASKLAEANEKIEYLKKRHQMKQDQTQQI